ncbi:hypothetical protein [Breoghania sp.]|uniref:hypothetical protein n=1 Tax=Breoghania sp. TaxID=2065378 RepID=UPI002AA92E03|nr:hypothetical protein [Breoghania sp.]
MTISDQILAALDAALENGYPHDYDRPPADIAREIHDWSGIDGFDPDAPDDMATACAAVNDWRWINEKP